MSVLPVYCPPAPVPAPAQAKIIYPVSDGENPERRGHAQPAAQADLPAGQEQMESDPKRQQRAANAPEHGNCSPGEPGETQEPAKRAQAPAVKCQPPKIVEDRGPD